MPLEMPEVDWKRLREFSAPDPAFVRPPISAPRHINTSIGTLGGQYGFSPKTPARSIFRTQGG